jgi:signal transduction histidine kinase
MSVRLRLALTVLLSGLVAALGVIVAVAVAFQRFEHENTWQRADAFLERVNGLHDDLMDQHRRNPEEFGNFLRNLMLYEPNSQLYLLAADGRVLVSTGKMTLAPDFKVALKPVQQAAQAALVALGPSSREAAYVMGDDPEYMRADAVVAARALRPVSIRRPGDEGAAGYLYLVCRKPSWPETKWALVRSSVASPALLPVLACILLTTGMAAWVIVTVTRPLRVLSDEVAQAARTGFSAAGQPPNLAPAGMHQNDEFGRLRNGFHAMLATLRLQWDELRRLDSFRREGVSNLSHDLRSPLTATVACLETLEQRWSAANNNVSDDSSTKTTVNDSDRHLVHVALRNTRNAADMVRSLGDLALLDEPEFKLHLMRLNLAEVLDDITLRFAERAQRQGVALRFEQRGSQPPVAEVDVELFERAVANMLDNALKFTPAGGAISLTAEIYKGGHEGSHTGGVRVCVADQGAGIAPEDLPHLFDRLYQSRSSVAPASSEEGKGLGLTIVKRIIELHRGTVSVASTLGQGTTLTVDLPGV